MNNVIYRCLNPKGSKVSYKKTPLCKRRDIKNKRVYLIDIGRPNSDVLIDIARRLLQPLISDTELVYYSKTKGYRYDEDEQWWKTIKENAAAAIIFVGDCGSGTMRTITFQRKLELMGIPNVSLVCTPFIHVAHAVSENVAMPALRWVEIPYPITDITDEKLEANIKPSMGKLVEELTRPLNEYELSDAMEVAEQENRFIFEGSMEQVQDFFAENELADGLPIVPPTEFNVNEMLKGTSHDGKEIIGRMPPEFLEVTVEKVAINGAMCGCRPEHMPMLLTICEIMMDNEQDLNVSCRSTTGFAFWAFANGPEAKRLNMNSGANALGQGNRSNAVIGRAVRIFLTNLGGSRVGVNEMATIGNPLKYGFAFAENEDESPWPPYHVDKGFDKNDSTVTVCESWGFRTQGLTSRGKVMGLENILWSAQNVDSAFGLGKERGIMILLDPLLAKQLNDNGIGKKDIKEYMWRNLTRTVDEWKNNLSYSVDIRGNLYPENYQSLTDDAVIPKFQGPDSIQIVVVGGENSPFYIIFDSVNPYHCTTKSIEKWR